MPYVRRNFRKKGARMYRRKGGYRSRVGFAKRVQRAVRSFAEHKLITQTYSVAEVDWTGRVHALTNIPQGVGVAERTGKQIELHSVTWKIAMNNAGSATAQVGCMMIVLDTQQVGDAVPTPSQILIPTNVGTVAAPTSLLNSSNRGRFKVLYRRTFSLADQTGSDSTQIKMLQGYKKLRGVRTRYNGTASTDIERNGLYAIWITDGDPAGDDVFITGDIRLYYTDI